MQMLNDLHPTESIYYVGYIIIKALKTNEFDTLESLYCCVKNDINVRFSNFVLALDWLYCLNAIDYNLKGSIYLCI